MDEVERRQEPKKTIQKHSVCVGKINTCKKNSKMSLSGVPTQQKLIGDLEQYVPGEDFEE